MESAATPAEDQDCTTDTAALRAALPGMTSIRRVLMIGRWTYYADGAGIGLDQVNRITLGPAPGSGLSGATQADLYAAAWDATVAELARSVDQIAVLRQVPEIPQYDSRQFARRLAHGQMTAAQAMPLVVVQQEVLAARVAQTEAPLTRMAAAGRITLRRPKREPSWRCCPSIFVCWATAIPTNWQIGRASCRERVWRYV